jgi:hypothetical protein
MIMIALNIFGGLFSMETDHILYRHRSLILLFAKKYICWETPEIAIPQPYRVLDGAMNLGSLEDYHLLLQFIGKQILFEAIFQASFGWFSQKPWSFWYRILDLVKISDPVPPLPDRVYI